MSTALPRQLAKVLAIRQGSSRRVATRLGNHQNCFWRRIEAQRTGTVLTTRGAWVKLNWWGDRTESTVLKLRTVVSN